MGPQHISRVLVVPTGKLGDVVCNTPVLRALREHLPQAKIIVAGNSALHQPLLANSGLVDEYLDLEVPNAIERVRQVGVDAALITGPSFEAVATMYLAGVPLVVAPQVVGGFSPAVTRPYKILRRLVKVFPYSFGVYAPRERLRVLEPLGIVADDTTKHLGFSAPAGEKIQQFFANYHINPASDLLVGISPSAGNKIKEWPVERFAAVAQYLIHTYRARIIIAGSVGDKDKTNKLVELIDANSSVINTAGEFNLDEVKSLIANLKLFIAVDTGPIYIAEAFKVPTVDITGPIDEREQPPITERHRVVTPPEPRQPELFVLNAKTHDQQEALRQTKAITVKMVTEIIDNLLQYLGYETRI